MTDKTNHTEPMDLDAEGLRASDSFAKTRWNKSLRSTVPLVLAGALSVSMTFTGAIEPASAAQKKPVKPKGEMRAALPAMAAPAAVATAATSTATAVPATHKVSAGDTVSSIAGRYGLSTASVLALNGLGWKSLIFPGQVLKLGGTAAPASAAPAAPTTAAPASGSRYTIQTGDTVSKIAGKFGVSVQNVLSANKLGWSSIIYPGQTLTIPGRMAPASSVTPAPVTPPAASGPAAPTTKSYTIVSGDTLSSIASKFRIGIDQLLLENGLKSTSVIFAGRSLKIPTTPVQDGSSITPLTGEMAGHASTIISVGRDLGVSDRGIVIALAAAMQESSLRNIDYGDRDSIGLFQQRPSTGWGSKKALLDPVWSSKLFYGGPSNPNRGVTNGLLDIAGWERMSVTQAAQAVQISAYPNAYAKWEKSAAAWLAQLG